MLKSSLYRCILPIALFGAIIFPPAPQSTTNSNPTFHLHKQSRDTVSQSYDGVDVLSPVPPADQPTLKNIIIPDVIKKTKAAWYPIIPPEAKPPKLLKGVVLIRFTLSANGHASNLILEQSSGNVALDRAAWNSIHETAYAPFPSTVTMGEVKLRFAFLYNNNSGAESSTTPPNNVSSPDSTGPHL